MKYKYQAECMNESCRTVVVGDYLDGIRCPKCDGLVNTKPFEGKKYIASNRALFVRSQILERCKEHCFDLTPEQVDTVLSLGDEYEDINISKGFIEQPLLNISLADIDSVPVVYYNGEEINMKVRVSFDYETESDEHIQRSFIRIEHADPDSDMGNFKVIQHNYPIKD